MRRFNSSKVRALGNLQPLSEKQKAHLRRVNGIKVQWSQDRDPPPVKKVREFDAPVKPGFVPAKPRGRSGCRMSAAKRAMVLDRAVRRAEFFASLGE